MEWERRKGIFAWDGSLRDIYVLGTDASDWQRLLDFLRLAPYDLRYTVGEQAQPLPDHINAVFARTMDEPRAALSVDGPRLKLMCHFFWLEEIEFDLDPRVIDGEARLERLLEFMRELGRRLGKDVILTPENMPGRPLYRFDPRTGGEDWLANDD